MSLLDDMPHRCSIYRLKRVKDALGGSRDVAQLEQEDVECWDQQASANQIADYMQRGIKCSHKVFFPTNPGVTAQHEIRITSRDRGATTIAEANQLALTVASQPEPDSGAGLGVVYRVMCDEWSSLR